MGRFFGNPKNSKKKEISLRSCDSQQFVLSLDKHKQNLRPLEELFQWWLRCFSIFVFCVFPAQFVACGHLGSELWGRKSLDRKLSGIFQSVSRAGSTMTKWNKASKQVQWRHSALIESFQSFRTAWNVQRRGRDCRTMKKLTPNRFNVCQTNGHFGIWGLGTTAASSDIPGSKEESLRKWRDRFKLSEKREPKSNPHLRNILLN